MDLNSEYSAYQRALMLAQQAGDAEDRASYFAQADLLAGRIASFQLGLGAAAACAWSATQFAAPALL